MEHRESYGNSFRADLKAATTMMAQIGLVIVLWAADSFWQSCAASDTSLPPRVSCHTSAHFVLYTDLDECDARDQLRRLDRLVASVSQYWGQRLRGKINCYLVDDLANWDGFEFSAANARFVLRKLRGGTDLKAPTCKGVAAQANIYATTDPGVAEHEAVHAYCFQTFGRGGPEWYREGMAQVFSRNAMDDASQLHDWPKTLACMRETSFSAADVFGSQDVTPGLHRDIRAPRAGNDRRLQDLAAVRMRYARAWALCHLLSQHPDYQERFRALGRGTLSGSNVSFEEAFAGCRAEIDFELAQFGQNYEAGYRVDRCRWKWGGKPQALEPGKGRLVRLRAGVGYQPTGIQLGPGETYGFESRGTWKLSTDRPPCDADGNHDGTGRLVAVVFKDFELSHPVELGKSADYESQSTGSLYLRCQDAWNQLSDNRGTISIRIERIK